MCTYAARRCIWWQRISHVSSSSSDSNCCSQVVHLTLVNPNIAFLIHVILHMSRHYNINTTLAILRCCALGFEIGRSATLSITDDCFFSSGLPCIHRLVLGPDLLC